MDQFLIVGGGGNVGRRIADHLNRKGASVIIGGRRAGEGARHAANRHAFREVDLNDSSTWVAALEEVQVVIVCIDVPDARFAAAVLAGGRTYIDITASDAVFRMIEALDTEARATGGTAILSVGLAPGLTNLLALEAARGMEVRHIDIGVCLGLGETHGRAAIDWTLDRLGACDGSAIQNVTFHACASHPAIPFDFADQHVLRRRHGWPAITRLAFDTPVLARVTLRLAVRMARSAFGRGVIRAGSKAMKLGSDKASISIVATGGGQDSGRSRRLSLQARGEAEVTATMVAETALMVGVTRRGGVWHLEEIFKLADFERALIEIGVEIESFGRPAYFPDGCA